VQGGKQCYGLFAADTAAALMALEAKVIVLNSEGERSIPIDQFYTGEGDPNNILGTGDFVGEIQIPVLKDRTVSRFSKHALRNSIEFGIASVAVSVTFEHKNRTCAKARIALSSVSSSPVDAKEASGMLAGKVVDEKLIEEVANAAVKEIKPVSSIWASVYERRHVARALVRRTLSAVMNADS